MIIICAWCKTVLGVKEPITNTAHTHGICEKCSAILKQKYKIMTPIYWDDIEYIKKYLSTGRR